MEGGVFRRRSMKALPIIAGALVGLAAGGLVAWQTARDGRGKGVEEKAGAAKVHGGEGAAALTEAPVSDAMSGLFSAQDNPRIVRLFSALREPVLLRKRAAIYAAIQDLEAAEIAGLIERVEKLPQEFSSELIGVLADRWLKLDYEGAEAWILGDDSRVHWRLVEPWAKANPERAMQAVLAGKVKSYGDSLLELAVREMVGLDDAVVFAKLKTLAAGRDRDGAMVRVLGEWARKDPQTALARVGEIEDSGDRKALQRRALEYWADRDPKAALTELQGMVPELKATIWGNSMVTAVAERAAKKDPKLVLSWLEEIPPDFRVGPAIGVARIWAQKEPVAALEWCMENGVDVVRTYLSHDSGWLEGVLSEAVTHAPEKTVAWLEGLPPGDNRDRLLERALSDGIGGLPADEKFKAEGNVLMRIFGQLPEEGQRRMSGRLGQAHGERMNLTNLGSWAQMFPEGAIRGEAIAGAIGAVYEKDASKVEALLATTAPGRERDAALRGLTAAITEPSEAAARAMEIGDAAMRRKTLEGVIEWWNGQDPAASGEWLRAQGGAIPAAWTQAWLENMGTPKTVEDDD
jgi:hypothetical protein